MVSSARPWTQERYKRSVRATLNNQSIKTFWDGSEQDKFAGLTKVVTDKYKAWKVHTFMIAHDHFDTPETPRAVTDNDCRHGR